MQLNLICLSIYSLLACPIALHQKDANAPDTRNELKDVLVLARDAIIEMANQDGHSPDEPDRIEKRVNTLYEYLTFIDDRKDIEYLREHLKKKYAASLEDAASILSDREAFSNVVNTIETEENAFQHDTDLMRVTSQEIERGFLEDALSHSTLLKSPGPRYQTQGQIALAAHESGKTDLAQHALDAAIQSASEEDSSGYLILETPSRKLDRLASSFLERNFQDGARRVILRNQQLLSTSASANGFDWRFLAERAIELGDLKIATEALARVAADEGHADVEDALKSSRGRRMSPARALEIAKTIVDPYSRSRSLSEIAERQASFGDKTGATATFQLALGSAEEIDQFKVFALNEIAWAQIRSNDNHRALQTLNLALKENEKPSFGSDQVDGWAVVAETLAYLGQFDRAREIVMKISDSFYRGRGLGFIASREVEAGRTKEVIAWSSHLSDPEDRCESFLSIAQTLIAKIKMGPQDSEHGNS